ncbi:MAG TPA: SidA/IucD/PvdA family monooxygenase [Solirubrobacteraceae bacterium]|nr:SidA/IucD/PvdA family monooxygenase [Solirubrobacteraceae bacterium]
MSGTATRGRASSAPIETDLLVVGAGAKGTAIAIKASVLNALGLGPVATTVVEATGPAAAWLDGNGVTSSREVLAISPSKDVGFPYESSCAFGEAGRAVDEAALRFSWQRYLVEQGRFRAWVDAGSPPVQRRVYGAYLAWVLAHATDGVSLVRGRVARVSLSAREDRWLVDVAGERAPLRYACCAFVLTGPGVHRTIPHELDAAGHVLDCDSGRMEIARVPLERSSDIAIVGGGESALSCMEFVRSIRPDAQLTVYTPTLPMSRVESFVENRVFSNPDTVDWPSLSLQQRREFIARGDRGVFGPERIAAFGYDERCRFVDGRVMHVSSARGGDGVRVEHATREGAGAREHDYLINCTGFDLLEQLRSLLAPDTRTAIESRIGPVWDRPPEHELRFGRFLQLEGLDPRLHLPGLAAVSQGPGFANLGSLGVLADRVLQPFFSARVAAGGDQAEVGASRERR